VAAHASSSAADDRRRAIVASAADLFDREGFANVSVGRIAEAVGIAKPTLYHYVSSKDELLTWIHEEFIDQLGSARSSRPSDLPAADELRAVIGDILGLMESHRSHVRVFFEHHRELPDAARERVRTKRDEYQRHVEDTIRRGIAAGELRDVDPRLASFALFGMCNWAYQWFSVDGALPASGVADLYAGILLRGLGA
jgi:AcrR family transcriptional regulator